MDTNIKSLRLQKGISQFKLSTELKIPVSRVSRHENGYRSLPQADFDRVIHFLSALPDAVKSKPWMKVGVVL